MKANNTQHIPWISKYICESNTCKAYRVYPPKNKAPYPSPHLSHYKNCLTQALPGVLSESGTQPLNRFYTDIVYIQVCLSVSIRVWSHTVLDLATWDRSHESGTVPLRCHVLQPREQGGLGVHACVNMQITWWNSTSPKGKHTSHPHSLEGVCV